jgi:hypothetical protein
MAELCTVHTWRPGKSGAIVIIALGQVGGASYTCDHVGQKGTVSIAARWNIKTDEERYGTRKVKIDFRKGWKCKQTMVQNLEASVQSQEDPGVTDFPRVTEHSGHTTKDLNAALFLSVYSVTFEEN